MNRRGDALMIVILTLAALGSLGAWVAFQADNGRKFRGALELGVQRGGVLARIQGLRSNYDGWVGGLAARDDAYKNCFVTKDFARCHDGMVAGSADAQVTEALKPMAFWQAKTWDLAGAPLGGTESAPVTLDADGQPCASAGCAVRFRVYSYMAQSGPGGGDPDFVQFYFKVSTVGETAAPLFAIVNVGQSWKQTTSAVCPNGVARLAGGGATVCAAANAMSCPDGHYLAGFDASGAYLCARFE